MTESEKLELILESYKLGSMNLEHASEALRAAAYATVIPSLDILQEKLGRGAGIHQEDDRWSLRNSCGELISDGESVREMLINLIFSE